MQCLTCSHSRRLDIDRELVSGNNMSAIARKYDVSYHSLEYHAKHHISRQLSKAVEIKMTEHNFDLLDRIDKIIRHAESIFDRNYKKRKDGIALKALDSQRQTFELLCKISAHLHQVKMEEARAEAEQTQRQSGNEISQSLQILSTDEMIVFARISEKLETQDPKIDCLAEFKNKIDYTPFEEPKLTRKKLVIRKPDPEPEEMEEEPEEPDDDKFEYTVQPVLADKIQSTPWQEHPLNQRVQFRRTR